MKKVAILGCLILFLAPMVWAQEKVESPVWKVGDKWTYRADNGWEWTFETIGDEKDLYSIVYIMSEGQMKGKWIRYYNKKDMNIVKVIRDGKEDKEECQRLNKLYNFPLFSGKKWTSCYSTYSQFSRYDIDMLIKYSAIGFEDVEVPAGKFRVFKVKVTQSAMGTEYKGNFHYWWAPDVRNLIKFETDKSDFWARGKGADFQKFELVSFELK